MRFFLQILVFSAFPQDLSYGEWKVIKKGEAQNSPYILLQSFSEPQLTCLMASSLLVTIKKRHLEKAIMLLWASHCIITKNSIVLLWKPTIITIGAVFATELTVLKKKSSQTSHIQNLSLETVWFLYWSLLLQKKYFQHKYYGMTSE